MQLTFHGGVGMVTGSNFLLEENGKEGRLKILVDCGLMQGSAEMEALNWNTFPYDPAAIDLLVVTHAHIDHIGRIPKLVRDGFCGQIISTEATKALSHPMLIDSMGLLHEVAEKHGREILYEEKDIAAALKLWRGVFYHEAVPLSNGIALTFLRSGHILGAGMAQFAREEKNIIFTGDLGGHSELLEPAESIAGAQYLVQESVYGDRMHDEKKSRIGKLQRIIGDTATQGGTLLIPAFSTERTQDLLYDIHVLLSEKKIPSMPVFCDSPLATEITRTFLEYPKYFKPEIAKKIQSGENVFSFQELRFVVDVQESHRVEREPNPKIIIAGSGMSSGGRVLMHEKRILSDKRSTLCLVGYQAAGSRGRQLIEGAKKIALLGEKVRVEARIEHVFSYSAHMDSRELLEFAAQGAPTLKKIFVVMGEPAASAYLAQRLRDYAGLPAVVPAAGESVQIAI